MPDSLLYEYALVRLMPRVDRGEFINVGLLMMCKRRRWIRMQLFIDADRIRTICPDTPIELMSRQLEGFRDIAHGKSPGGPIASCAVEERFRWLTAAKSACIVCSAPHPGITVDLDGTFDRLFRDLVL